MSNLDRRRRPKRIGRKMASRLITNTRLKEPIIHIQVDRLIDLLWMPAIKRWYTGPASIRTTKPMYPAQATIKIRPPKLVMV